MGLVQHAVLGGRRDFASVGGMEADRYEVLVDERFADEAEQLLGTAAAREPAAARDPEPTPEAGPAAS
jgi:hypothetical protein